MSTKYLGEVSTPLLINQIKEKCALQYSTMPTPSYEYLGKIVQYIGATTSTYTHGYFYECVSDGAISPSYSWENIEVGDYLTDSDLSYVTPEMFGAVGDGVTDDTQAFTDAFVASKNVKCNGDKTYYFNGIVNVSQRTSGTLDINGAHLNNFHIKIGLKDNGYEALSAYPSNKFVIKNGFFNSWNVKSSNWQTPIIQSGAIMQLENLSITNNPYLLAVTNSYRDNMIFKNINFGINIELWDFTTESLDLDAVTVICQDLTFARINKQDVSQIPTSAQGFAGDGWIVESINEVHVPNDVNSDYGFIHFFNQQPIIIKSCVQSKFYIGQNTKATFLGCHFETPKSMPQIQTLATSTTIASDDGYDMIKFDNCYFNNNYQIENIPNVEYDNCFFRVGDYATDPSIPFSYTCSNQDWYDLQCIIHNCNYMGKIINNQELSLWKNLPKLTRNWRNGTEFEQSMANRIVTSKTLASGNSTYPEVGNYQYTAYTYTNNASIAHETYSWTRTVDNIKSAYDATSSLQGYQGGWGMEVYRTLPSGQIQRCRFYDNPNRNGDIYIIFIEYGNYATFEIGFGTNQKVYYIMPWINVSSIPSYTINNKVYEKNGVLVTIDNSKISGLSVTRPYSQIDDKNEHHVPQISALPTPNASREGLIYLLTATQTGYQKGGIYQCVSDGAATPTYSWELISATDIIPITQAELEAMW